MTSHRTRLLWLALLIAAVACFYISTLRPGQPWADDFGQYAQQAKNIATGAPYDKILFVYEPGRWNPGPRVYPPVFSLILAAVYRWRGLDLTAMKLEIVGFFILVLFMVFYAFRQDLEFRERLALVAILGFNPVFWNYKDVILSDIPFLFFAYLALFLIEWSWSVEGQRKSWLMRGLLIGLAMYAAYGTRNIGGLLVPVAVTLSLLRTRRITKDTALAAGLCVALILLQSLVIGEFQSYISAMQQNQGSIMGRVPPYLHFYAAILSIFWSNSRSTAVRSSLFMLTVALAVAGGLSQARRRIRSWEIFAVLYVPLLFVWEEDRYLFPLIPLYAAYMLGGVEWLGAWKGRKWQTWALTLLLSAVGLSYVPEYSTLNLNPQGTAEPQTQQLFEFVRTHLNERDVIEFPHDRTLSLFTERHASQYNPNPPFLSDTEFWNYLRRVGVSYVTITPFDEPSWIQFVDSHKYCWKPVFANSEYHVERVRPPGQGR